MRLRFPFDFASNVESNYCFIDFKSPNSIIAFYKVFEGKRWRNSKAFEKCRLIWARKQEKLYPIESSSSHQNTEESLPKRKLEVPDLASSKLPRLASTNEKVDNEFIKASKENEHINDFIKTHDSSYVLTFDHVKLLLNKFLNTLPSKKCSTKGCVKILEKLIPGQFFADIQQIGFPRKFCARYPSLLKYRPQVITDDSVLADYITIGDGVSPDVVENRKKFSRN